MSSPPDISLVLPCYRAAALAERSLVELAQFFAAQSYSYEIIVVDDGGGDFADTWPTMAHVRLIRLPRNQGKGAAVRAGMLQAQGRVRIFTDVDLPYAPERMLVAADYILQRGFHVVVGDRTLPGSEYELAVGWARRLASGVCSMLVGTLVTGGYFDTQCGLKGLRGDVADALFRHTRINRFAFDVEVLYLALRHRLDIKRIPVRLRNNETSSVRLVRDSLRMLWDIASLKYFQLRRCYDIAELHEIVRREAEAMARTR